MSVDYTRGVTGRDPVAKAIIVYLIGEHPDWSNEQIAERINLSAGAEVIDAAEVAHWRAEAAR